MNAIRREVTSLAHGWWAWRRINVLLGLIGLATGDLFEEVLRFAVMQGLRVLGGE